MLRVSNTYKPQPILSLQSGIKIGMLENVIINPNNLKIEGWHAKNLHEKGDFILPSPEIRDVIRRGIVVNDHTALTEPDDLVRLQDVLETNFSLVGIQVVTESGRKLGKVADYALDDKSYYIQKLYVSASILRGLSQQQHVIDRRQIIEISDRKITVPDVVVRDTARTTAPAKA